MKSKINVEEVFYALILLQRETFLQLSALRNEVRVLEATLALTDDNFLTRLRFARTWWAEERERAGTTLPDDQDLAGLDQILNFMKNGTHETH